MADYSRDLRLAKWGSGVELQGSNSKPAHVRFGSKADIGARPIDVRFTPESGHWNSAAKCPLCAKSRHSLVRRNTSLFDHLVSA